MLPRYKVSVSSITFCAIQVLLIYLCSIKCLVFVGLNVCISIVFITHLSKICSICFFGFMLRHPFENSSLRYYYKAGLLFSWNKYIHRNKHIHTNSEGDCSRSQHRAYYPASSRKNPLGGLTQFVHQISVFLGARSDFLNAIRDGFGMHLSYVMMDYPTNNGEDQLRPSGISFSESQEAARFRIFPLRPTRTALQLNWCDIELFMFYEGWPVNCLDGI